MKRFMIVALVLTTCLFASQTFAASGMTKDVNMHLKESRSYLTLSGGATKMNGAGVTDTLNPGVTRISVKPGYNASVAVGLSGEVGRIEIAGGVIYEELDQVNNAGNWTDTDGEITVYHLMGNVYFDFNQDGAISPYVGGGIGAGRLDITSSDLTGNDATSFMYQVGAGLTFNTSDSFVIDLGYKMMGTNNLDFGGTYSDYFIFQNVNLGLRWLF